LPAGAVSFFSDCALLLHVVRALADVTHALDHGVEFLERRSGRLGRITVLVAVVVLRRRHAVDRHARRLDAGLAEPDVVQRSLKVVAQRERVGDVER
jgi:hypothetical protein